MQCIDGKSFEACTLRDHQAAEFALQSDELGRSPRSAKFFFALAERKLRIQILKIHFLGVPFSKIAGTKLLALKQQPPKPCFAAGRAHQIFQL